MELTGLWWFFGSLIPWLAFGARWLNFKNKTHLPSLSNPSFGASETPRPFSPSTRDSRVCRLLDECLALPVLRELGLLELCKKFLSFAKEQHHSPAWGFKNHWVCWFLTSGFWLLWRDVVSILESIAKKLLFEKWRLRSKNFAFIMWCFFCTPFWEKEICYREDAPQHAYNSWGAWLSLLWLWRGRGLYSQDRDHSKQP